MALICSKEGGFDSQWMFGSTSDVSNSRNWEKEGDNYPAGLGEGEWEGWRPEMLLNILQSIVHPPPGIIKLQVSIVPRLRNLVLKW